MDNEDGETLYMACLNDCNLTPEQAIAATLGSGTLTAEQVRETVEKHWHDLPVEYGMLEATALPEFGYDWQGIADELNEIRNGACEIVVQTWHDHGGYDSDTYEFVLSCGHTVEWLDYEPPRHCPRCGKAVKR